MTLRLLRKVLSLRTRPGRDEQTTPARCAEAYGFSLQAGAHWTLCRCITRPAIANERLERNGAGDVVLQLKSAWRDGTPDIVMSLARANPLRTMRSVRYRS